ncbi:MAG: IS66 family insertion sequence element accessory protein TnpA [Gammaproteobacteria bacterium]
MNDEHSNLKKISKDKWFGYIDAWEKSGKTQPQFCEENNLSYITFGYWRTCYLKQLNQSTTIKQQHNVTQQKSSFIPVKVAEAKSTSPDVIQARFSSGLTLALPLSMPTSEVIKLLQALAHHHED